MDSDESKMSEAGECTGRVKWFDSVKGYGFLTTETHSSDFVIFRPVLNSVGIFGLPEGTVVDFVPEKGERGMQVKTILAINFREATLLPKQRQSAGLSKTAQETLLEGAGDFEPVEVKWFDWSSGYGFLYALDRENEDVFVHAETLRYSGIERLQPNDQLDARLLRGPRGLTAAELKPRL